MLNKLITIFCLCLIIVGAGPGSCFATKKNKESVHPKKIGFIVKHANADANVKLKRTGTQANDLMKQLNEKRVFFGYDQSNISEVSADILLDIVEMLQDNPDARILLTGHTDNRGSHEYNLALGAKRADAAKMFMINCAPYLEKRIRVASKGEIEPLVYVSDHAKPGQGNSKYEKEHAKNRRVEFSFFME
jgi:peptidoglycan-associated lipoprotein